MILEFLFQVVVVIATGLDVVLFAAIPDAWERPVTSAIANVGLGTLGAVKPILSQPVWVAWTASLTAMFGVWLFRKTMSVIKLIRAWFP